MKYFKTKEWVSGYYIYSMPLDENALNSINEWLQKAIINPPTITLEQLEAIAEDWTDNDLYYEVDAKSYGYINDERVESSYKTILSEFIYDALCEDSWDYDTEGFMGVNTDDVERWIEG